MCLLLYSSRYRAGVAQLVEQLICNQQVGGSSPSTSSTALIEFNMGEFPSGQRGQTVNLLAMPSMVRIHLPPPNKEDNRKVVFFVWWENFWIRKAALGNVPVAHCNRRGFSAEKRIHLPPPKNCLICLPDESGNFCCLPECVVVK